MRDEKFEVRGYMPSTWLERIGQTGVSIAMPGHCFAIKHYSLVFSGWLQSYARTIWRQLPWTATYIYKLQLK